MANAHFYFSPKDSLDEQIVSLKQTFEFSSRSDLSEPDWGFAYS